MIGDRPTAAPGGTGIAHEPKPLRQIWWLLLLFGLLSLVAGLLAFVYPDITLLAVGLILGINVLFLGAFELADALVRPGDTANRVLGVLVGVLGVIAGIVILRRPGESLLALVLAAGIWLILSGILQLAGTIAEPGGRGPRLLAGLVDLVVGIVILVVPDIGLRTFAILVGIGFVVRGLLWLFAASLLRRIAV
jgi:uncharacterized membrane protein HdeD (DUF308 family)